MAPPLAHVSLSTVAVVDVLSAGAGPRVIPEAVGYESCAYLAPELLARDGVVDAPAQARAVG